MRGKARKRTSQTAEFVTQPQSAKGTKEAKRIEMYLQGQAEYNDRSFLQHQEVDEEGKKVRRGGEEERQRRKTGLAAKHSKDSTIIAVLSRREGSRNSLSQFTRGDEALGDLFKPAELTRDRAQNPNPHLLHFGGRSGCPLLVPDLLLPAPQALPSDAKGAHCPAPPLHPSL